MAKTSYITIPPGSEDQYLGALKSGDRFQHARIIRNDTLLTKRRKVGISARSLLPQISALWAAMSQDDRDAWAGAAAEMSLKGWQLFVQDQSIRIKNEMSGVATPALTHQSWVGKIVIGGAATEAKIVQIHPSQYWIIHKVYKKKGLYEPVSVNESFALPLEISISYKSDLTSAGADPFVKFYAKIKNSYQGKSDDHILEIPLSLSHSWETLTATLSALRGTIIGYELFIHLHDVTGTFYFDNIKALHSGQNWARDPFCKQVAVTFTHAYQQIPKHWAAVILPDGAEYDSVYEDF